MATSRQSRSSAGIRRHRGSDAARASGRVRGRSALRYSARLRHRPWSGRRRHEMGRWAARTRHRRPDRWLAWDPPGRDDNGLRSERFQRADPRRDRNQGRWSPASQYGQRGNRTQQSGLINPSGHPANQAFSPVVRSTISMSAGCRALANRAGSNGAALKSR